MSGTNSFYIEKYVDELGYALSYIHSIDGFLIKLGTVAHELEETCRDNEECSTASIIREILKHPKLRKKLSHFSCYTGEIIKIINTDPRHKILRKYVDVIKECLEHIECVEEDKGVTVYTPEALWVKERKEKEYFVKTKTKISKKIGSIEILYMILGLVALLFVLSMILLLA